MNEGKMERVEIFVSQSGNQLIFISEHFDTKLVPRKKGTREKEEPKRIRRRERERKE